MIRELEAPSKIMIVGDTHSNTDNVVAVSDFAAAQGIDLILQVGDFGIWPGEQGRWFLDDVSDVLRENEQHLWFVDGNHEDFDQLYAIPVNPETGMRDVTDRIHHLPRGFRWSWNGTSWLALGGASSIDRGHRVQGASWWPQETLSYGDVARAIDGGHADVMLTHDCPAGVDIPGIGGQNDDFWEPEYLRESQNHRKLLLSAVEAIRPRQLFHGHFHTRYTRFIDWKDGTTTTVDGLGHDRGSLYDQIAIWNV